MSLLDKNGLSGKAYWRSLDQLADTPEFKEFLNREFPAGTADLANQHSRRTFLKFMGASMALAGLTSCRRPVEKIVPYVKSPENVIPGIPKYFATVIPDGVGAHGVVVESHEGRPTKIEGNEKHPSSQGAANSRHQAEILNLYDPDRPSAITSKNEKKTWAEFAEFWRSLYSDFLAGKGEGLALLSPSSSSPTLARLQREFQDTFPAAKWVTWDAVSDENIANGIQVATGQKYQHLYHLEKADVILSLDADILGNESASVASSKGFSRRRRIRTENDSLNRLYIAESTMSVTGGMADHRMPLQGRQIGALAAVIAQALKKEGVAVAVADSLSAYKAGQFDAAWVKAIAADLAAARGKSLIVAGKKQPANVHALVFALNTALGNVGKTVSYCTLHDKSISDSASFVSLASDMASGKVKTLISLGGNPVYAAPVDTNFRSAYGKLQHSIHLGVSRDETGALAEWHIPETHFLEAWGDARAHDGTMSVVQPLIAPLFDSHSAIEVLALLISGREKPGYELVRDTWRVAARLGSGEKIWRRVLHDGLLADSAHSFVLPSVNTGLLARKLAENPFPQDAAAADNLEIGFTESSSIFDGRFANNGWLQEVPDPVTKIAWGNAALISVKYARELGVKNRDVINLAYEGQNLEVPVWIQPGQADYSVAVELGYGRKVAGRIGDNMGFNAYALRTSKAADYARGLKIVRTGRTTEVANTQDHSSMEGRAIVLTATADEYREHPTFAIDKTKAPHNESMWEDHKYDEGYQWAMAIDLNLCTGCSACTVACQSENNIPVVGKEQTAYGREMHWMRLDRYFEGEDLDNPQMVQQPVACQHCEMAPCEQVCPVAATTHDEEGLNTMTYNRCIGTRYCANNCPYKVRRFNFYNYTNDTPEIVKMAMNPNVTVRFRGVMEKCTFCVQRINEAKESAKQDDRKVLDGDLKTACQQTCPTDAIVFGDINNPESEVSKTKEQNRNYNMLNELNLRTRTSFLAKIRNPNPALEDREDSPEHA